MNRCNVDASCLVCCLFLSLLSPLDAVAQLAGTTQVVVLDGQDSPKNDGYLLYFFGPPSLNDSGDIAFFGAVSNDGGRNGIPGAYRVSPLARAEEILRAFDPFPDLNGNFPLFFPIVRPPSILADSTVSVPVASPLPVGYEVFLGDGTGLEQLPGAGSDVVLGVRVFSGLPFTNRQGDTVKDLVAFDRSSSDELGEGFYRIARDGNVSEMVRFGGPTATPNEEIIEIEELSTLQLEFASINDEGEIVFRGRVRNIGSGATKDAIFRGSEGAPPAILVSEGDPIAGEGITFVKGIPGNINEQSQTAFVAFVEDTQTTGRTDSLLFHDGTALQEIARNGEVAPNAIGRFARTALNPSTFSAPVVDDLGGVSFVAGLTGVSQGDVLFAGGVFRKAKDAPLQTVLQVGDPTPSGGEVLTIRWITVNSSGQLLIDIVDGLLFYDPALGVFEVVKPGDPLLGSTIVEVSEGAQLLHFVLSATEANANFNDLGQVAYSFELGNRRTGVAVWTPPTGKSSLLLPSFEVEPSGNGRTTFLAVHNHDDMARDVTISYFDVAGNFQVEDDVTLGAKETRTVDFGSIAGLATDGAGIARGLVRVEADAKEAFLTGDYFFVDFVNNFASGDPLPRPGDVCKRIQVRLLDFGSGVGLKFYSTNSEGPTGPTASFRVFDESGMLVDTGTLLSDGMVESFSGDSLTSQKFGTLEFEFVEGSGSLLVEYSAFGRFSVAMNGNCIDRLDSSDLVLPSFEVDTRPGGVATFLSVHNVSEKAQEVVVSYQDSSGTEQASDSFDLRPKETRTVNIRGVGGLTADADGIVRGSAFVRSEGLPLVGDYIVLDSSNDFASGSQLLRASSICDRLQVRLVDFGSGKNLQLYATQPQGTVDPTATFTVYDDAGTLIETGSLFADQRVVSVDDLTTQRFGTMEIEFLAGGGALVARYSAFQRFSVGLNAHCTGARVGWP